MASREAVESRLSRRKGMSEEAKTKFKAANATLADWYGTCRMCGEELSGTLKQIMEHKCGPSRT